MTPDTPPVGLKPEDAIRRLEFLRDPGHCGEGTLERQHRERHNAVLDMAIAALRPVPASAPEVGEPCPAVRAFADELREGCIFEPPLLGMSAGPVDQAATDMLLAQAADMLSALSARLAEVEGEYSSVGGTASPAPPSPTDGTVLRTGGRG